MPVPARIIRPPHFPPPLHLSLAVHPVIPVDPCFPFAVSCEEAPLYWTGIQPLAARCWRGIPGICRTGGEREGRGGQSESQIGAWAAISRPFSPGVTHCTFSYAHFATVSLFFRLLCTVVAKSCPLLCRFEKLCSIFRVAKPSKTRQRSNLT